MTESSIPSTFAARLRDIREKRELSQSELAREAGMQPSAIAHFEAGRRKPSFDNVRGLAKALKVTADYLLGTKTTTTAFRDEDKLSAKDRNFIQNIIDTMIGDKK
ncbi:helix-turn-helix domain-containing protein [Mesorhizobium sp. YC-39]|uniref:helix-turn-helix domain-containing protein n=1 Tax=unclassified Mesorhizobium TaxID=325217 RepID=UPI0021E99BA6|nr:MULTISPECIES: helix-turn-helix transcriptional regulator [unclassified Mesorhizobium]MCV3211678.1 helix-turn-helix domain-containing protein [Mesorhizobium sp. YC-2]MCV3233418.1 helix-turn-helix domain-containing protein [Mesorhizobium sp. YC-39]